jgi:hypothetical protein
MNLAGKSIRWKPLGHCIGIKERPINSFWRRSQHSVKSDGVRIARHNSIQFFVTATNEDETLGQQNRSRKI